MLYSIQEIAKAIAPEAIVALPNAKIERLLLDSRLLSIPSTCLFFALKGSRNDGHQHVGDLLEKGVQNFVIDHKHRFLVSNKANFLVVDQPVRALQALARIHRQKFSCPVISVTGSNGKTVFKEWLGHVLSYRYRVLRNPKSFNSQIGVPLSVWGLNHQTDIAIFEAGISMPGEMEALQKIIQPDIGVFTNLGSAHQENFQDADQKIAEKFLLFKNVKTLIYNIDQGITHHYAQMLSSVNQHLYGWSATNNPQANLLLKYQIGKSQTIISYNSKHQQGEITIPFTDPASIENASHVLATCVYLGFSDHPESLFRSLPPVEFRLELLAGQHESIIVSDVYSSDIESLNIAIAYAEQQAGTLKKCIILSDMQQSGLPEEKLYRLVASIINEKQFNRVFAIGKYIPKIESFLDNRIEYHHYTTTASFLQHIFEYSWERQLILIKGARTFHMENIAEVLGKKQHPTSLGINLSAVARNLRFFEEALLPATKILVMVKANAYGSGAKEIANYLQTRRVDYFGVAYTDEGVELRQAGIKKPILVLNPDEYSYHRLLEFELEPEVYSLDALSRLNELSAYFQQKTKIHLKLDTGMKRLGFEPDEIKSLIQTLAMCKHVEVASIFSHLSASELPESDSFTMQQIQVFQESAEKISTDIGYRPIFHILNSAGIIRFSKFQFDMVRLGIGLYGIGVGGKTEAVHSLKCTISQIKKVDAGASVGYGRKGIDVRERKIATINIGYADGLMRKAGNGRFKVKIGNQFAEIVGDVCMDMTMVDISHLDNPRVGDEVVIFDHNYSIEHLAKACETIPYEIFTNLSQRVKRIYSYD